MIRKSLVIHPLIARGICPLGGFEAICTRCDDARRDKNVSGGVKNSGGRRGRERTKKLHGGGAIQEVTVHFFKGPDRLKILFVVADRYNFGCHVLEG